MFFFSLSVSVSAGEAHYLCFSHPGLDHRGAQYDLSGPNLPREAHGCEQPRPRWPSLRRCSTEPGQTRRRPNGRWPRFCAVSRDPREEVFKDGQSLHDDLLGLHQGLPQRRHPAWRMLRRLLRQTHHQNAQQPPWSTVMVNMPKELSLWALMI